jgi:drug/metabolite transporter (DMT)-like permease
MRIRVTPVRLAQLGLLVTVAIWGSTFVIVKDALRDASPLLFNAIRMALATVALVAMNRRQLRGVTRSQVWKGAAAGAFLAAGYELQTLGLAHTTATKSGFLTGLVVVFVPLFSIIPAVRARGTAGPGVLAAGGIALAFGGMALLTTPAGTAFGRLFSSIGFGDLLTLGCAVAFAGHLLTLGRVAKVVPAGLLATLQIGAMAAIMLAMCLLDPAPHLHPTVRLGVALAVTSLLGTAAAFTMQSYAQQHLPPTHTAVLLTLEPVFAGLTSVVVLGERMGSRGLSGAGLILAGILVTELLGQAGEATEIPA